MGSTRTLTLRLEKANVLAQMELQRANIADCWREASQPVASIEHGVQVAARHSWAVGGFAAVAGILLAIGGNYWLMRKALKFAVFAVPYLISHRKSGAVGYAWSLVKKLAFRWF